MVKKQLRDSEKRPRGQPLPGRSVESQFGKNFSCLFHKTLGRLRTMRNGYKLLFPLTALLLTTLLVFLKPAPQGLGTHQALGLPPCLFLTLTGLICPSCGLTTSWTHFVHGNFLQAWQSHLLGPPLYILFMLLSAAMLLSYFREGSPVFSAISAWLKKHLHRITYGALSIYFGAWIIQLVLKISDQGWKSPNITWLIPH